MAKLLISRSVKLDGNGNGVDHVGGAVVIVATLSIGPSVDITWLDGGGNESGTAQGILSGQKAHAGGEFSGIKLKGQPNDVCSLYIGPTDASLDSLNALNAVIGHVIVDNEVEVKNDAGNALACDVPGAQKLGDNADAQAAAGAASLQGVIARLAAWNGATFDRLKIGAVAGSLLADVADRAGRLLGVVTSTSTTVAAETIADNADAQAVKGANVLQGVVSRLQAWNGATFDRLKIGATAGSLLTDLADRAARVVGVVSGALGSLAQAAIGGVNALVVTNRGITYGASYISSTLKGANTPDTVFSAASNVNGAIVWRATFVTSSAGTDTRCGYLAKTSAPATSVDGDPICTTDFGGQTTGFYSSGKLDEPVFIPAGKGLYYISQSAEGSSAQRGVLYTLL